MAKVMLGIMFGDRNFGEALATASAFRAAAGPDVVLGLAGDVTRRSPVPSDPHLTYEGAIRSLRAVGWTSAYLWDDATTNGVLQGWNLTLPYPFYPEPSYGGNVNKLLALAKIAGCQYLVRVDAGTAPLPGQNFGEIINLHTGLVATGVWQVVSGQYSDRIALRTWQGWVPSVSQIPFYLLVRTATGIDPLCQVTGGAAFTIAVDNGPPLPAFPGIFVWGSDDGFLQVVGGASVVPTSRVARTEVGFPLKGVEYPVRLASMVALASATKAASTADATQEGDGFLRDLNNQFGAAAPNGWNLDEAIGLLGTRISGILQRRSNYRDLVNQWPAVLAEIVSLEAGLTDGSAERW